MSSMTANEFCDIVDSWGMTRGSEAAFLETDDRTRRRWASGAERVPPHIATFLRAVERARAELHAERAAVRRMEARV